MNKPAANTDTASTLTGMYEHSRARAFRTAGLSLAAAGIAFLWPLSRLVQFSIASPLFSYIPLIPCVSAYIVWSIRHRLSFARRPNWKPAATIFGSAAAVIIVDIAASYFGLILGDPNRLAIPIVAFVLVVAGTCVWFFDSKTLRALLFPIGFLLFMIPIPNLVLHQVESFMQVGSATVAHNLFKAAGTPVYYSELHFQLPNITLYVAPECSGIRSTLVLFIVSTLTGYFFLRSKTGCVIISASIIPLALLRNGFRIFVIGELCVHVGPDMIDSPIHHRGGPIFFALSLVPLFFLVYAMMRLEQRRASKARVGAATASTDHKAST